MRCSLADDSSAISLYFGLCCPGAFGEFWKLIFSREKFDQIIGTALQQFQNKLNSVAKRQKPSPLQ